ncbi:MAG: cytochrome c oxidase subunit 3, partial [Alphaproteobacteria bacterium]|nr:cytochrome c oxidase subunit 3 [Alphaproteobacteria bacterium]
MSDSIQYTTTGQPHPYHIVRPSPWPLLSAFSAGALAVAAVTYFHHRDPYAIGGVQVTSVLLPTVFGLLLCLMAGFWFRDIIREASVEHAHTRAVKTGFRYGMLL